jgi:serine/threonine protein kinase
MKNWNHKIIRKSTEAFHTANERIGKAPAEEIEVMASTRGQNLIGKTIGNSVLEQRLGYGGSSAVYLARGRSNHTPVAIKVFLPRSTMDSRMHKNYYRRFLREAEATSKLRHPFILPVHAYGEHDGMPYIIMPYMSGGTLADYVLRQGPLALEEACHYIRQIADALDYAHSQGCVHCDVKPANILIDGSGKVVLSDFGIVRLIQAEEVMLNTSGQTRNPNADVLMGTPDYVSPEQALGEPLDGRADIYSLAASLYFLLTGEPPFKADTPIALALMHVHETPPPLGLLRGDITPQIEFVLNKALAKWPDERYQTAEAFANALMQAIIYAQDGQGYIRSRPGKSRPGISRPGVSRPARSRPQRGSRPGFSQPGVLGGFAQVAATNAVASDYAEEHLALANLPPTPQQKHRRIWQWSILLFSALLVGSLFIGAYNRNRWLVNNPTPTLTASIISNLQLDHLSGDQYNWPTGSTQYFQSGRYYMQNTTKNLETAFYSTNQYTNFQLSITTTEMTTPSNSGDYYGVILRASSDETSYYLFEMTAMNGGEYDFQRYDGEASWKRLASGSLSNFHAYQGQANLFGVTVHDNTFTFTLNNQQIDQPIQDTDPKELKTGSIGLMVYEQNTMTAFTQIVAFSHLYIKQL